MVAVLMLLMLGIGFFLGRQFLAHRQIQEEVERPFALDLLNSVLWMQTAAERKGSTLQAYRLGERMLDVALEDTDWTAALEQTEDPSQLPPAVILDVDETVLDNSAFQAELIVEDELFQTEPWNDWCRREEALPIPGAVHFTQYAAERGVVVFYVTNRRHEVEEATRRNLERLGFPLDESSDRLYTRGEKEAWDVSDKGSRRADIASHYRILLLFGDDLNDFVSDGHASVAERDGLVEAHRSYWGSKWIVLPNPEYGSWEGALVDFDYQLSPAQRLRRKYQALRLP